MVSDPKAGANKDMDILGLNPCLNGRWSLTGAVLLSREPTYNIVLILVWMEKRLFNLPF